MECNYDCEVLPLIDCKFRIIVLGFLAQKWPFLRQPDNYLVEPHPCPLPQLTSFSWRSISESLVKQTTIHQFEESHFIKIHLISIQKLTLFLHLVFPQKYFKMDQLISSVWKLMLHPVEKIVMIQQTGCKKKITLYF